MRRPGSGRTLADIEVQHLPTTMFQHEEHKQHFHRDRRYGEKVHGYRLAEMVVEKCLPALCWRPEGSDDPRDSALRDRNAEHLQFAMDAPSPADDRVGLDVHQRTAPAGPPPAETDPEYPIQGRQNWSFPFALEGGELQSQCRVLERDSLVAAHQQPHESADAQQKGWHESRFFRFIRLRVKPL